LSNLRVLGSRFWGVAGCLVLVLAISAAGTKGQRKAVTKPPLDFSGVWQLDPKMSLNVSSAMKDAVLAVTQRGDRIWISPVSATRGSLIMAEEIVADGRPYEKTLGPGGKGTVTAGWARDRQSLWIEVRAGDPEDPKDSAIQRSVWKLSADRTVWVRESVSMSKGTARTARLVFRRKSGSQRTPAATIPPSQPTPTRP
jgi:hypothetical protein